MCNALTKLKEQRESLSRHLAVERAKQQALLEQQQQLKQQQDELKMIYDTCLLKKEILEQASTTAREEGKLLFEKVVTNSLQMVFDETASAFVALGNKNNTPTAEVMIRYDREGKIVEVDPCEEDGGGIADIVSTGIFMATSLLGTQENVAPFFLDEPTKYVSDQRAETSALFLKSMTEYTGRQTILSTHEREYLPFTADRSFFVQRDNQGVSHVEVFAEAGILAQNG